MTDAEMATCFFRSKAPEMPTFSPFCMPLSHNPIKASRGFAFHVQCVSSIRSKCLYMIHVRLRSVFGILQNDIIWSTSDQNLEYFRLSQSFFQFISIAFQKLSIQNWGFPFLRRFFLNFMRREKSFVCVEVLRPSQPNGVMLSVVSLPNHTFTGQA